MQVLSPAHQPALSLTLLNAGVITYSMQVLSLTRCRCYHLHPTYLISPKILFANVITCKPLVHLFYHAQRFPHFFKSHQSLIQMRLRMCCRQLHPNSGLPFRHYWKKESYHINAFIQQFGSKGLR